MLEWNDLRLILAVARTGSFAAAAEALGVSGPTVFRHAKAAEERLGTLIFRRDTTGVSLSPAGRDAASAAERIEDEVAALEARIGDADSKEGGTVRLATVDTLLAGPLMPLLRRFQIRHPRIVLDVQSGIGMANLRQREVDAALRAGGEPPEELVGRRLCHIAVAVYRNQEGPDISEDELSEAVWLAPDDQLGHLASARWLKQRGYQARASFRANSLHTLALAAANGLGVAILPCYLADLDSRLARIGGPIAELASDLWFLTHNELRHRGRIRALSDFLYQEAYALRPLFSGETPASSTEGVP
jgi:DNA-binding transcriptional LysR family regulator